MIETTKLGLAPFDAAVGGVYFNMPTVVRGRRGCGKTVLAAHFADKVLRTGERLLYFCESQPESVILDARSAGFDFESPVRSGQLALVPVRSAFSVAQDGEFPFAEALGEMRALASRTSAGFAVFSSVVPWLAVSPVSAMPRRVDELLSALSAASLTSLLLVHKPASSAAEALVSKLSEECPVVLEMDAFGSSSRELRVIKYRGRDDLRLPMSFSLELASGKGLVTPVASPVPEPAGNAAVSQFAVPVKSAAPRQEPVSASSARRRSRAMLFQAPASADKTPAPVPGSASPSKSASAPVAPSASKSVPGSRRRATLFSAPSASAPAAPASAPAPAPVPVPAPSASAPAAKSGPRRRATLFSAPASAPFPAPTQAVPSVPVAPSPPAPTQAVPSVPSVPSVPVAPTPPAPAPTQAVPSVPSVPSVPVAPSPVPSVPVAPAPPVAASHRGRIRFSNVIR